MLRLSQLPQPFRFMPKSQQNQPGPNTGLELSDLGHPCCQISLVPLDIVHYLNSEGLVALL